KVMGLRSTGFVGLWMMAGLILLFGVGGLAAIRNRGKHFLRIVWGGFTCASQCLLVIVSWLVR
ncbi:hypothetical protein, partial [Enterococcus faecium]|uniref:hypothetical protein n=1 Tax=Enterococcus faecium TaxID=1352 RepID=UPI003F8B76BE